MRTKFPTMPNLSTLPACYRCGHPTEDLRFDGLPPGKGAYSAHCTQCDTRTWFDVAGGKADDK